MSDTEKTVDWFELLDEAIACPEGVAEAQQHFRKYSLCNRWLAASQFRKMGLPLSPINTFKGWLAAERPVQKGQKASISLVMPVPIKKNKDAEPGEEPEVFHLFMLRRNWFHLGQTDGKPYDAPEETSDDWVMRAAMDLLEIEESSFVFSGVDAAEPSFARARSIAVSPLETCPTVARLTQMAKILLGHTVTGDKGAAKSAPMEAEHRELEALATAYLVCASLGFTADVAYAKKKLQHELCLADRKRLPAKLAQRAFGAADKVINAGYA